MSSGDSRRVPRKPTITSFAAAIGSFSDSSHCSLNNELLPGPIVLMPIYGLGIVNFDDDDNDNDNNNDDDNNNNNNSNNNNNNNDIQ